MDTVSIIMPTFNEENYIKESLESILVQNYPKEDMEIIIIDGMSTDKTREIIGEYIKSHSNIRLLDNPKKTVNHALNIGIKEAKKEYIVRVDAHSKLESDYINVCIETIKKTGAFNVGGPIKATGKTRLQKIIAALYSSKFALGGSQHYEESFEGYADTVEWGTFRREDLIKIGMYDENLPRSEDEDLNCRIAAAGGKIYVTSKAKYIFYAKETYKQLFKQYFNYGLWKPVVIKKHEKLKKLKYFIPLIFVIYLVLLFFCFLFSPFRITTLPLLIYIILNLYFSFQNEKLTSFEDKLGLAWAHVVVHIAYGLGMLNGLFKKRIVNQ